LFLCLALTIKNKAVLFVGTMVLFIVPLIIKNYNFKKTLKTKFIFLGSVLTALIMGLCLLGNDIFLNVIDYLENLKFIWHLDILKCYYNAMAVFGSWNIWWFIFGFIIIWQFKKIINDKKILLIFLFWFVAFIGFILWYMFSVDYAYAIDYTSLDRTIMLFLPTSIYLAGLILTTNDNNYAIIEKNSL